MGEGLRKQGNTNLKKNQQRIQKTSRGIFHLLIFRLRATDGAIQTTYI